jgi:hypothetical protein
MSYRYGFGVERDAYDKGRDDGRWGRTDWDRDRFSRDPQDEAYFEGLRDERRRQERIEEEHRRRQERIEEEHRLEKEYECRCRERAREQADREQYELDQAYAQAEAEAEAEAEAAIQAEAETVAQKDPA